MDFLQRAESTEWEIVFVPRNKLDAGLRVSFFEHNLLEMLSLIILQ